LKLAIIREYASAYSTIMDRQDWAHHVYIDAFCGSGWHLSRTTGEFVDGSPINALLVSPPFDEYFFIDIDCDKASALETLTADYANVNVRRGDCNPILIGEILPLIQREPKRRALCLLDPYGLQIDWAVVQAAGKTKRVELFVNFPIEGINRNVLWRAPERVDERDTSRMNMFWGNDDWVQVAYPTKDMFGNLHKSESANLEMACAYRDRLMTVAGFQYVPDPLPMRNSKGAIVYYLFFAAQKPTANKILEHIFAKYRDRGAR